MKEKEWKKGGRDRLKELRAQVVVRSWAVKRESVRINLAGRASLLVSFNAYLCRC